VKALADYQNKLVDQSGATIKHEIASARTVLFGVGLAVLMAAAAFAWWLTRSITGPINNAVKKPHSQYLPKFRRGPFLPFCAAADRYQNVQVVIFCGRHRHPHT